MTRPRRPGHSGLTLVEVLAAVAVLGVGYVTVIQAGSEGLLREGETRRHLEASLIADQALFEIELDLDAGMMPESDAREVDGYEVVVEVSPVALAVPPPERDAPVELPALDRDSLLGGSDPAQSPLRRIELSVAWQEGFGDRAVSRTTFAFDRSAALGVLDALAAATELGQAEGASPDAAQAGTGRNANPADSNDAEGEDR